MKNLLRILCVVFLYFVVIFTSLIVVFMFVPQSYLLFGLIFFLAEFLAVTYLTIVLVFKIVKKKIVWSEIFDQFISNLIRDI